MPLIEQGILYVHLCSLHWPSCLHVRVTFATLCMQWPQLLNKGLEEVDPELFDIIEHEKCRQYKVRQTHRSASSTC